MFNKYISLSFLSDFLIFINLNFIHDFTKVYFRIVVILWDKLDKPTSSVTNKGRERPWIGR